MGLDMYLTARKSIHQRTWAREGEPEPTILKHDGMQISAYEMQAAYWRKHPNLHGYVVKTFADGVDECQPIDLSAVDCRAIATAIRSGALPHTEGFFFGDSDWHKDNVEADAKVFDDLATWLESGDPETFEVRRVTYQASW